MTLKELVDKLDECPQDNSEVLLVYTNPGYPEDSVTMQFKDWVYDKKINIVYLELTDA